MNSLLTWMCTHYTHALHMYLRLVFVYMPRTNIHSFGKRGKGCGQARLVGTCTCALYVWVHTVHWEQSKDKLIDLYINLLWIHVTGISTDIHTSYVVCLYTMNSLLTWMCTHYTHALHMYLRLVFVYMPRTNIHSFGKRGKGCGQARLVGTCTCALYVWVHTVHWEQSKDKLIDLYINLLWIHVTGISTDIHTSYVYTMNSLLTWMCTHYSL